MEQSRICVEGQNCWRVVSAQRATFLIDGASYFATFAAAVERARKSILIVGWDIDSRIQLIRDDPAPDLPTQLGALLNAVVARRRGLQVHVLGWDFAMLYALDREPLPVFTFGWRTHRRVHFRLDGFHPVGASHHQKIVVIDDAIAFVGGLDLAKGRWDTPAHQTPDPRRKDPNGRPYPPFHDVQLVVDGAAAAALGDLVRERWRRATGRQLRAPSAALNDPWPSGLPVELENITIAIARTQPAYQGSPEVREVEALYLAAISAARQSIYIENQYFTSAVIGNALTARLQERDGPAIVLVLPQEASGWLEESTMGVLRARLLQRLRAADRFGRLHVYAPVVSGLGEAHLRVHAKVLIVDDRLARVGSANLNNRSMGLDTECDLTIEAGSQPHVQKAIARFRNRLVGEHLGVDPQRVTEAIATQGSFGAALEEMCGGERTLIPLEEHVPEWLDELVPDSALVDPERPLAPEKLVHDFLPPEERQTGGYVLIRSALLLAGLLGLAAAWRWTPMAEWVEIERIADWATALKGHPAAPLIIVVAYLVGSLVLVPITLLILATAFAYGPLVGCVYSFVGCVLAAILTYGIGAVLGRDLVRSLAGSRLSRVSQRVARHGIMAVVTVRVIPVAPFTVVNLVAGASHICFRDFTLGTGVGMAPGILALSLFEHQLENTLRNPETGSFVLLMTLVVALVLIAAWTYRWLTRSAEGEH